MRHRLAQRKLGRTSKQRMALLKSLAVSVLLYEKVTTTEAKAKEVRGIVDKLIRMGKNDNLHNRRLILAYLGNNELVMKKLLESFAIRYVGRTSGFTTLVKVGYRSGDNAPSYQISLV